MVDECCFTRIFQGKKSEFPTRSGQRTELPSAEATIQWSFQILAFGSRANFNLPSSCSAYQVCLRSQHGEVEFINTKTVTLLPKSKLLACFIKEDLSNLFTYFEPREINRRCHQLSVQFSLYHRWQLVVSGQLPVCEGWRYRICFIAMCTKKICTNHALKPEMKQRMHRAFLQVTFTCG